MLSHSVILFAQSCYVCVRVFVQEKYLCVCLAVSVYWVCMFVKAFITNPDVKDSFCELSGVYKVCSVCCLHKHTHTNTHSANKHSHPLSSTPQTKYSHYHPTAHMSALDTHTLEYEVYKALCTHVS